MNHHTGLALAPRAQRAPSLLQWESLMQSGTRDVQAGRIDLALVAFKQALVISQNLLLDEPAPEHADDCLAALVVSHHNLADLCVGMHLLDQAAVHLCRAHGTVLGLLHGAEPFAMQQTALQHAAWHHIRETHCGLLNFQSAWGPYPSITRLIQAGMDVSGIWGTALH